MRHVQPKRRCRKDRLPNKRAAAKVTNAFEIFLDSGKVSSKSQLLGIARLPEGAF